MGYRSDVNRLRRAAARLTTSVRLAWQARELRNHVELHRRSDMIELGTGGYGSWSVPASLLGARSVCYLVGTGTDISFDLALIDKFGCTVHAFDPVPAAQEHIDAAAQHEPRFVFHPIGVWSSDRTLKFHAPAIEGHVSHSAVDMHGTDVRLEAPVRSIRSLMRELDDDHVDLLKISAEGAEYEILGSLERDEIWPRIVCVEFAQPADSGAVEEAYDGLRRRGYQLVASDIRNWTCRMTFVDERAR